MSLTKKILRKLNLYTQNELEDKADEVAREWELKLINTEDKLNKKIIDLNSDYVTNLDKFEKNAENLAVKLIGIVKDRDFLLEKRKQLAAKVGGLSNSIKVLRKKYDELKAENKKLKDDLANSYKIIKPHKGGRPRKGQTRTIKSTAHLSRMVKREHEEK